MEENKGKKRLEEKKRGAEEGVVDGGEGRKEDQRREMIMGERKKGRKKSGESKRKEMKMG